MKGFILDNTRPLFRRSIPNIVFRVYFNEETKKCLYKSSEPTIDSSNPHIVVYYLTYESIDVCDNFKIVGDTVSRVVVTERHKKLVATPTGKFKTTKNNLLFVVNDTYNGTTDSWDYYRYDH
jgi:hypothetical protein